MPEAEQLASRIQPLLADFLPRQRWYAGGEVPTRVEVIDHEVRRRDPLLLWLLADVWTDGAAAPATYQLVVGGRAVGADDKFLKGKERVTLGEADGLILYDALVDPELALDVLSFAAPDDQARVARPLLVEQSNTSVVYDERLILKLFRRLQVGPNPDVEVSRVLGERGFPHVVPQRSELRRDGRDLAVVRDYLLGATDAWHLAHTSLRDLLGSPMAPENAGADFAADAGTLGEVTARLHVAMAEAFGVTVADPDAWLRDMQAQVDRVPVNGLDRDRVVATLRSSMATVASGSDANAGAAIRIHGDLHLGQLLRSDIGWFVLDFEGEPDRPLEERLRPSSPLRDVAGMMRSFHYASRAVLAERGRDVDPELGKLIEAWEARSTDAFWNGYLGVAEVAELLPADDMGRRALLAAFELDKAVYEVGYELAHRPSWVDIPASAIERLTS